MNGKWWTALIALFSASGLALGATAGSKTPTLVYGETGRLSNFDPYTAHEASGQRLADLLFDSLVEVGQGGVYQAKLADRWSVEQGGAEVKFHLRTNVFWHADASGKAVPFSAEDVVSTVRILSNPASEVPNRERFAVIAGAKAISPEEVVIRFSRAQTDPLRHVMFKILPAHMFSANAALLRGHPIVQTPIGTGPYRFVESNTQGEVLLEANSRYFLGKPAIEKIVMKNFADQNVMAQSLMFSSLDLMTYVSPRDVDEIAGDRKLNLIPYDALSFSFFGLNTGKGILRDKRVRQALGYAVNRQEMLQSFFGGRGRLISGPFPPTSWAYNLDVPQMKFDVARAKRLLDEAGVRDSNNDGLREDSQGKPVKLLFAVPLAGESEMIKRIVLAFQNYLSACGVGVELQFMDWLVWKERVLARHDYDLTLASWSFDDASNISSLFQSSSAKGWGNNFVMYQNPNVDELLTEAETTNDFDKRRAIYQKLHSVLAEEMPYIYLWTLQHNAAHRNKVAGVRVEPMAFFKHILTWNLRKEDEH